MLFSEFCGKEVVCSASGARLGTVDDLVFDAGSGVIEGFCINGRPRWLCGERLSQDLYIPRGEVETVGADIILVRSHSAAPAGGRSGRLF